MVRVLIIGTRHLGLAVATTLARSGINAVFGLATTEAQCRFLTAREITPIMGLVEDVELWKKYAKNLKIDVIVDCTDFIQHAVIVLQATKEIAKDKLDLFEEDRYVGQKLGYVFVSSADIHGTNVGVVTDMTLADTPGVFSKPPKLHAWKVEHERDVLGSRYLMDVMIVRPSLLYGLEHALWDPFFRKLYEASKMQYQDTQTVEMPFNPKARPGLVHVDDAADGVVCAVQNVHLIANTGVFPVFDLCSSHEQMRAIFEEAKGWAGFNGKVNWTGHSDGLLAESMAVTAKVDSSRARQILGWTPKKVGFVDNMELMFAAWKANHTTALHKSGTNT